MDGASRTEKGPAWIVYAILDATGRRVLMEDRGGEIGLVYPGGNIEPGETPHDAAMREIREEIGIEPVRIESFWCACSKLLMHKGREGMLFVVTEYRGSIPDFTVDDQRRILQWRAPGLYAYLSPDQTGGFQIGRVARLLID